MEPIELLNQECSDLGIEPTKAQLKKVLQWIELLQKWNKTYNLTALNDIEQIIRYLVIDSLAAIPYLRGNTVLDVGSGSGVPGVSLAIFAPFYRYTLIDGNGKKARFLEHCRIFLTLTNVEIKQIRAENFNPSVKFDTIISRALSSLDRFISATLHLGDKQTRWLAFKSKISQQELDNLQRIETDRGLRHSFETCNKQDRESRNLVLVRY